METECIGTFFNLSRGCHAPEAGGPGSFQRRGLAMKRIFAALTVAGLAAAIGCNQTSGPATGTRTTTTKTKTTTRDAGPGTTTDQKSTTEESKPGVLGGITGSDKFTIRGPLISTTVKQGETRQVEITVSKGKDFMDDIKLTFEPDKGLKVEPPTAEVKASDKGGKVAFKVTADKATPVGEHHIKVNSTPPAKEPLDITIKVEKS
jgi:hypothetical protein